MCVQRFDDSLDPAIRITYRISRRSSSLWEPRDPSLKDVWLLFGCCLVLAKVRLLARGKKLLQFVFPVPRGAPACGWCNGGPLLEEPQNKDPKSEQMLGKNKKGGPGGAED